MRVIVPVAEGFEEIEAVTIIDILRRADVDVVVAGVNDECVTGSHGIRLCCDTVLRSYTAAGADAIVLPGGMPGTTNLGESEEVLATIRDVHARGGLVAAICAAPIVLDASGVLDGRRATSHPAHAGQMQHCRYVEERV